MTTADTFRKPGTNRFDFPSVAALAEVCRDDSRIQVADRKYWTGETAADTLRYGTEGNTAKVPSAEEILTRIEREADLATLRSEWHSSVAGAFPSVPDFLAGIPDCMRRRVVQTNESTPLTVWICTTSSGGVEFEDLQRRGVAVLALAMALANARPVEIRTFTALNGDAKSGDTIVTCRLAQPICLSEAAWALTACSMDRCLAMSLAEAYVPSYRGRWAKGISGGDWDAKGQVEVCRRLLGANAEDVIIPPATCGSVAKFADPVAWVIDRLREYKAQGE